MILNTSEDIANHLGKCLAAAIDSENGEVDVVRSFVKSATISMPSMKGVTRIRAGMIHQRPYAMFVTPATICGKVKCELGDILHIYKHKHNGRVLERRATFTQVKKSQGRESWHIEPHQLEFLSHIKSVCFRFGNKVYKNGGISPRIYSGLLHAGEIANYLLFDEERALVYDIGRIAKRQRNYQIGFSLNKDNLIKCRQQKRPFCTNHDSYQTYIQSFLTEKRGALVRGQLAEVVSLIYKKIGWEEDPPEEFADNFVEDGRSFAIVEVTRETEGDVIDRS